MVERGGILTQRPASCLHREAIAKAGMFLGKDRLEVLGLAAGTPCKQEVLRAYRSMGSPCAHHVSGASYSKDRRVWKPSLLCTSSALYPDELQTTFRRVLPSSASSLPFSFPSPRCVTSSVQTRCPDLGLFHSPWRSRHRPAPGCLPSWSH